MIDLRHPYLTRQLIAYIGNKRRLLPFIQRAISSVCGSSIAGLTFLDLFAGSGAVSRLAKLMGFRVLSNDWEEFARIINIAHVATDASEAGRLFRSAGGLTAVLAGLNALSAPPPNGEYIARFYAPKSGDVGQVDYRTERLFYTRGNAQAIDRIRSEIERLYPPLPASAERERERALLVAPLLYEAATHTNTSGVFKACHKGFGGHGGDALGRILGPIELEPPVLVDGAAPATVFAEDANLLARSEEIRAQDIDVAYVDPPYSTHQYGSNYHLLTSIARWDRPPAPLELDDRGVLRDKAGIRRDWIRTRSAYCSRPAAPRAFAELIDVLRSRLILVSYSTEGLIPFDLLYELCASRGSVDVLTNEYTRYPGGKQSRKRLVRNVETMLLVDTMRPATASGRRLAELALERRRLALLLGRPFVRSRLFEDFDVSGPDGGTRLRLLGSRVELRLGEAGRLVLEGGIESLGPAEVRELRERLERSVCADAEEELAEILRLARGGEAGASLVRQLPRPLRALAHRKNRERFVFWMEETRRLARDVPSPYAALVPVLDRLDEIAGRRFSG